ncbi:hypothetical protein [Streptomyces paludis]|uniref:hypothetical protein n=1 Tax=Streptomyces paludis TaxID=2282738 RepID=UPI001E3A9AE6|nr:hypothetical protein [Streptomyces paludis]
MPPLAVPVGVLQCAESPQGLKSLDRQTGVRLDARRAQLPHLAVLVAGVRHRRQRTAAIESADALAPVAYGERLAGGGDGERVQSARGVHAQYDGGGFAVVRG